MATYQPSPRPRPGELAELRELFATCPISEAELGLLHLAGALNERPADDGAVGNRDARYVLGVNGMWRRMSPTPTGSASPGNLFRSNRNVRP